MADRPPRATIDQITALVDDKRGNITSIARALGVSRCTIYNRISKSAKLQDAIYSAREAMIDNVESKLYAEALAGNTAAMIFFLKTQGKSRGYTERQEITGADGGPIVLEWPE